MTKCENCNNDQIGFNFKLCMKYGFMICSECDQEIRESNGVYEDWN